MMHSLFFNTVDFLQNALPKAIPKTMGDVCNDIKKNQADNSCWRTLFC